MRRKTHTRRRWTPIPRSKVFMRIGEDTVLGYNLGISNLGSTTKDVVNTWAKSFTSVSPVSASPWTPLLSSTTPAIPSPSRFPQMW